MHANKRTIWKLCFLIVPCLALPSILDKDGNPTPSSPYYRLPTSSVYTALISTSVFSSSSVTELPSLTASGVPINHNSPTHISAVYPEPVLATSNAQENSFIETQTSITIIVSQHHTTSQQYPISHSHTVSQLHTASSFHTSPGPHSISPGHVDKTTLKSMRGSRSLSQSRSHSEFSSHQIATKSAISSINQSKSSAPQTHESTKASSQTRATSGKSQTNSVKSATKTSAIVHSTTNAKTTANTTFMKSTSIKGARPSDDETSQQTRQSKPTKGTEKLPTSRSSRLIDRESSTTVKNSATTTNTDSIRSKHMPKTGTRHSNQQSVAMTNGDHETTVLHSKSLLSSTGRWTTEKVVASTTAASAQKTTGSKSTKKATRSDYSRSHTSAASTKKISDSDSSRIHTTGKTISSDPPGKSTGSDPRKTRTSAVSTKKATSSDSNKIPVGTISTKKTVSSDFLRGSTVGETTHSDLSRTHTAADSPIETTIAHSRGSQTTVASSRKTTGEDLDGSHSSEISVDKSTTSVFTTQKASSQTSEHSSITATEGQSASLPHPTTATTTTTTNSVIETIITGSMGTVVTYVATRDPKYTTNTKTTTETDDHGDDVIIYPGGWRWIPIGLPPLKFPPFKFPPFKLPPPPALNPDPEDHDHDHDRDQSKSTTKSEDCTTTEPPSCTKTVSYISSGTGFTSTVLGTCPPVSGCISGEQSTTTTTIATSRPYIWIKYPLEPDFADPLEEIDDDTIQYFNDLFDKQDISLEDDENLVASCGGNTPGIPVFCLNSFSTDFCQEVQADLGKSFTKTFAGLDGTFGPIGPIDLGGGLTGIHPRRLLAKRNLCSDWSFEFRWSGALFECRKSCLDYLDIVRNACFQFKSNDEGFLDAGCGTYNLVIKPILSTSTSTTESPLEPTEMPKTPLELKPVVCEDEANFLGHGDVHKGSQKKEAKLFCETYLSEDRHGLYMGPQNTTVWSSTGGFFGTSLYFSVSWIDGCETTVDSQNAMLPLGNDMTCSDILVKTYRDCINGGVGGYIDAGCLRYHFIGGK